MPNAWWLRRMPRRLGEVFRFGTAMVVSGNPKLRANWGTGGYEKKAGCVAERTREG